MKRNDIFMWAYITFVFFSIILRIFWEFPLWEPVVLAITISSMIFAAEDLFSSLARFLKESCDIADGFISTTRQEISKEREFLAIVDKKAEIHKDKEYNISDINTSYNLIRNAIIKLEQHVESFEKTITGKKNLQMLYQKCANLMAYAGFLCLFCVLIFSSIGTVSTLFQEIMTVLAFGVVLVTQQLNLHTKKKIKKDIADSEFAINAHQEASRAMFETEGKINYLLDLVDGLNDLKASEGIDADSKMEATANAN